MQNALWRQLLSGYFCLLKVGVRVKRFNLVALGVHSKSLVLLEVSVGVIESIEKSQSGDKILLTRRWIVFVYTASRG